MVGLIPMVQAQRSAPTPTTSKPSKPLLRPANLAGTIRKRDGAGLDDDLLLAPPKPNKRARVTFNPTVEEKIMDEYSVKGRSLEVIRSETRRAIEAHKRGDSEAYDTIKEVFAPRRGADDEEPETRVEMRTYLLALTSYSSELDRRCSGLVKGVVACEWMGRDKGFVEAYVRFLGSLASAQGAYVGTVLRMLVGYFHGVRLSSGRMEGCPDVNRDEMTSRIHKALEYLLKVVPSASSTLTGILDAQFPSQDDTKTVHITYIKNLIQLIEYAPELKSDVFALITDRLVKVDVQMQLDLDNLDDEVTAAVAKTVLNQSSEEDDGEDSDSDVDSVTSDEDIHSDSRRVKEISGNIEKMDAILDLLFTIYSPYFKDPNSVEATSMFETLLAHFTNIILPIRHARHTQFLLFHFAQTADHFVDRFAGTCVDLAFRPGQPAVLKQSAASYLASFVARGAHVEPEVIRTVFELIGSHLDNIRVENELTCRGPDLKRYGTFYAMTQALLYIFCFRWRDLIISTDVLEDDDPTGFLDQDLDWAPGIKETLSSAIYSKLNPLKICTPLIVSEFAKIAHHLRFLYVYPRLESNKRIRLSQFSSSQANGALRDTGNGGNDESWHQLESYFPFDPYQLPMSKRWVDDDYVQWKGVPGLNQDEESDDDSADEDDEEEAEVEENTATDEDDNE
ncbi:RNA polymerase I-specific transcription initiation factor rrn3 [Lachnellula cervina]|uniref:RNA polymerase I-specific transcription initiation factor rrn3 n=1 Tax=Lachnellula cervina TaxID=1316786 RepID=A0A7D8YW78_9HELO|nr:RNA polymerase I-specific transcription initiation factor rrn3 [Lachnellula cervina]